MVTLLAAGLVWLNVREINWQEPGKPFGEFYDVRGHGWPEVFSQYFDVDVRLGIRWESRVVQRWDWLTLARDAAVCVASLSLAAIAIEWLTRRLKRKPTL
jgi:hypothetical protein